MRNPSLVVLLTVISGFGLTIAEDRSSHYGGHHSGGIHNLYPGFHGLHGSHLGSLGSSMYGLGGYGMGHHLGYGIGQHLGMGMGHGLGMHGYGMNHNYGHHPIGHYGMPPTFIPALGGHKSYKKSYHHGHLPYSPILSLLGSHQYGMFGR